MNLYSIMIPVYNVEKYLEECINSVLRQTYTNYEVILIDDGSTDSSGRICDIFASDKRIKVVHKKNEGLLLTRRRALDIAQGDYCVFLDSDDYLDVNALQIIDDRIIQHDCDLLIINKAIFHDENPEKIEYSRAVFHDGSIFEGSTKKQFYREFLISGEMNSIFIKIGKIGLFRNDPFDYESHRYISLGEDRLQSFYPISEAKRIAYCSECLYYYRLNRNSMTHKVESKDLDLLFKKLDDTLVKECIKYAKKWNVFEDDDVIDIYTGLFSRKLMSFNFVLSQCKGVKECKQWIGYEWKNTFDPDMIKMLKDKRLKLSKVQYLQVKYMVNNNTLVLLLGRIIKKILAVLGKQ